MYGPMETALKEALADILPGVPVLGHLDLTDLDKGPAAQIKLSYMGYRPRSGKPVRSLAALDHRFAALLIVNAPRLDPTRKAEVEAAYRTLVERILAFKFQRFTRPEIEPTPEPDFSGSVLELGVFFTIGAVAGTQQE
jgi:hypothetical protein